MLKEEDRANKGLEEEETGTADHRRGEPARSARKGARGWEPGR